MHLPRICLLTAAWIGLLVAAPRSLDAQRPECAQLAPATTKAFLSIPDVARLELQFNKSQFGELVKDPVLEPFIDDVTEQLEQKLSQVDTRLGVSLADLRQVASGEAAVAVIQPDNNAASHAAAVMADVSGKDLAVAQLLKKIDAEMQRREAIRQVTRIGDVDVNTYLIPPAKGESRGRRAYNCVVNDWLLAADHEGELGELIQRLSNPGQNALSQVEAYSTIMPRVRIQENAQPEIAWFIEPFGYSAVLRASSSEKRRGRDVMGILARKGFGAIRGLGGAINFSDKNLHTIHRTLVLADSDGRQPALADAAQVLQLTNRKVMDPPKWVPSDVATFLTVHFDIGKAFPHVGPLVNALEDDPGLWESVLEGLEFDRAGPQLNVKKHLIDFLGERVLMVTRPHTPVDVDSEHRLYAFETTDEQGLRTSFEPALKRDPTFNPTMVRELPGVTIWLYQPKVRRRRPPAGGGPLLPGAAPPPQSKPVSGALAIANGYLMYATDQAMLVEFLKGEADPLAKSADYLQVEHHLRALGADEDCVRYFTRMSKSQLVNFNLMRQGKMPQAKTIMGGVLNQILAPDEPGVEREQQIDASKLPEFEAVEKYLGNGGLYSQQKADGWSVTGFFLRK